MKHSRKEITLRHSAIDLYNIVLNIEKYPDFLPWCKNIIISDRKKNLIIANMSVSYKFFPIQEFTSEVEYNSRKKIIKTRYVKGPLKDLYTSWEFIELNKNEKKIIFIVKFEFKNFLHQKIAELFFPLIEVKMIESFIERANNILD